MTYYDLQPLPLGRSTFSALIAKNAIYVDKTAMVYQLAKDDAKVFLARPRRFGKSLLVSTFESLFKHGLRDFKGLAIENLWHDKTYSVARLDFSSLKEFSSKEQFQAAFQSMVTAVFSPFGFEYEVDNNQGIQWTDQLKTWMTSLPPSSLVILIDEYDAPLTAHLDQPEKFIAIRDTLEKLYSVIKEAEGCLRFFFMTGITKFSNTSIFSAFNNLTDISLVPAYGTLLGITENELTDYFGGYIAKAADKLELSQAEVLEKLRQNYDGFSFDNKAKTHVYCPWSILQFFNLPDNGFQNYWYQSGGQPTVLLQYLAQHALVNPAQYNESIVIPISDLDASRHYKEINIDVLLTQSGYLTGKEIIGEGYIRLGYPNQEVATSMARLYADELLRNQNRMALGIPMLPVILANDSIESVFKHFNQAFNALDYHRYPVVDEAATRSLLQVLLLGAALMPRVENHTALGRSDLEVEAGNRHWVFEIKFARKDENVEGLLAQAVDQVKSRRYGEFAHGKELLRVAMVFSETERQFVAWEKI